MVMEATKNIDRTRIEEKRSGDAITELVKED
jgi:hypothetical protein